MEKEQPELFIPKSSGPNLLIGPLPFYQRILLSGRFFGIMQEGKRETVKR